jgi:hypothetical protein
MYPLPDNLPTQISKVAPPNSFTDWLPQFLALRDVSNFVVAASVQYAFNRETRDVRLQTSSARSRNAVINAVENMRLPGHLFKADLISTFSETFSLILPETRSLIRHAIHVDEIETDAIDALCAKLKARQVILRTSDREVINGISKVTGNIELLDDPSGLHRSSRPRLYVVNCGSCHLFGDAHLRNLGYLRFPVSLKLLYLELVFTALLHGIDVK